MKFQGSNCPATVVAGWLEVGELLPLAGEVVVRCYCNYDGCRSGPILVAVRDRTRSSGTTPDFLTKKKLDDYL